jgi:hypothetical protein
VIETRNIPDPIPAIDRAVAVTVRMYDRAKESDDAELRAYALLLLAHLRHVRKGVAA